MTGDQLKELLWCVGDFKYFAEKYLMIDHPTEGMKTLSLYPYQERLIQTYQDHRFVIYKKFRQGGFTTMSIAYGLWKAIFQPKQTIMVIGMTDRQAVNTGEIAHRFIDNMPEWVRPKLGRKNQHVIEFPTTGSRIFFVSPVASRGKAASLLIIDEAAFIKKMDKHWKSVFPCVASGGRVIVNSTINVHEPQTWFEKTYNAAVRKENTFYVFESNHKEHPSYANEEWVNNMRSHMGEFAYKQEVLMEYPWKSA